MIYLVIWAVPVWRHTWHRTIQNKVDEVKSDEANVWVDLVQIVGAGCGLFVLVRKPSVLQVCIVVEDRPSAPIHPDHTADTKPTCTLPISKRSSIGATLRRGKTSTQQTMWKKNKKKIQFKVNTNLVEVPVQGSFGKVTTWMRGFRILAFLLTSDFPMKTSSEKIKKSDANCISVFSVEMLKLLGCFVWTVRQLDMFHLPAGTFHIQDN